jgi:hypothetical protein
VWRSAVRAKPLNAVKPRVKPVLARVNQSTDTDPLSDQTDVSLYGTRIVTAGCGVTPACAVSRQFEKFITSEIKS